MRIALGIATALLFNSLAAQPAATFSLDWGKTSRSKIYSSDFLGRDAKGGHIFFATRVRVVPLLFVATFKRKDYFNVYDERLNFKKSVEIDLPKIKATTFSSEKLLARTAVRIGREAYVLQQSEDGDNYVLQAWKVDLDRQRLGKGFIIGKIPDGSDIKSDQPAVAISPDSSKVAVYFPTLARSKGKEGYYFFVLNKDLSKNWWGRGDIPYDESDYVKQDVTIDNQGVVTVTGRHYIPKKERKRGDPKWEPVILRYTEKGKPERVELDAGGKFIQQTFLAAGRDNQTLALGFYGNSRWDEQDGIFFAKMGADGRLAGTKTFEFDNEFMTSTMREAAAKRAKNRMDDSEDDYSESNFQFKDLVPTADGGFLALGQQYFYYAQSYQTGIGINATYTYNYNHVYGDIVAAKFSRDGSLAWVRKLNHYDVVVSGSPRPPLEREYGFTTKGDRAFIVFEDDERAVDNRDHRKALDFGRQEATVVAEIDENGKITRRNIETSEERAGNRLFFPSIFQLENGKVLMASTGGLTGRRKRFGLLSVKN